MHVGPSSQRGQYLQSVHRSLDWGECSDEVNLGWAFNDYLADTTILYSKIFNHPKKPWNFKMLVFSGDSDGVRDFFFEMLPCVNFFFSIPLGLCDGWNPTLDL